MNMGHIQQKPENAQTISVRNQSNFDLQVQKPDHSRQRRFPVFPNEIVERIVMQLSQSSLRRSASLVCRQWNVVCRRFVQRSGVWRAWVSAESGSPEELALLEKIRTLDRIICSISTGPAVDPATGTRTGVARGFRQLKKEKVCITAWKRFMKALIAPIQDAAQENSGLSDEPLVPRRRCLLQYIQHLIIRDIQIIDAKLLDPLLLNGLKYMRTIRLEYQAAGTIQLFTLLNSAPFLESLTVKCPADRTVHMPAGDSSDHWSTISSSARDAFMAHSNWDVGTLSLERPPPGIRFDEPRIRQRQYRLQHFNVTNVNIMHHVLERLITTCPDLLTLKVQEVNRAYNSQGVLRLGLFRTILLELCSKFCKRLEWFHVSPFSDGDGMEDTHLDLVERFTSEKSRFLTRTFCKLQTDELPPNPRMMQVYSAITLLRVHPRAGESNFYSDQMSRLLCFMSNLLYLYARDTSIHVEDLRITDVQSSPVSENNNNNNSSSNDNSNNGHGTDDTHGNIPASSDTSETFDSPPSPSSPMSLSGSATASGSLPVAWACKSLKTLELRLAFRQGFTLGLFVDHFMTYCPRITHLHLVMFELNTGQSVGSLGEEGYCKIEPDVKLLVGLVHLEEITLSVRHIRGDFDITGMEFMRSHSSSGSREEMMEHDDLRIVWPQLVAFNVRYSFPKELNCSEYERGLEAIRPGVEFQIRRPFFT